MLGESNFVKLSFWWTNPTEAAAIVKIVGRAYENDRKNYASSDLSDRKMSLTTSIEQINQTITSSALERGRILQEQKVESLDERLDATNRATNAMKEKMIELRTD